MAKRPSAFTFANVAETLTLAPSDTVDFVNDSTNNPDAWDYFFMYTTAAGNVTFVDLKGVVRLLTAVPAFTMIPLPMKRVNLTATTSTGIACIPKGY